MYKWVCAMIQIIYDGVCGVLAMYTNKLTLQ